MKDLKEGTQLLLCYSYLVRLYEVAKASLVPTTCKKQIKFLALLAPQ